MASGEKLSSLVTDNSVRINGLGLRRGNCCLSARGNIVTESKTDVFQVGKEPVASLLLETWCWADLCPPGEKETPSKARLAAQKTLMERKTCLPHCPPAMLVPAYTGTLPRGRPARWGRGRSRCQAKASPRSGFAATLLLLLFIRAAWLLLACCLLFFTAEQISFKSNSCCWSAGTRCLKQPLPRVVSVTPSRSRARSLQRARASWQHCNDSRSGHSACPSQPSCICSIILRAGWFLEEFRASSQRSWNANARQAAAPAIRLNRADKLHL